MSEYNVECVKVRKKMREKLVDCRSIFYQLAVFVVSLLFATCCGKEGYAVVLFFSGDGTSFA